MAERLSQAAAAGATSDTSTRYTPGNEADFERLYQSSYGKVLATLTVILRDREAAEDCTQDAFERAYKKWPSWQPIAPAEAWVHRIAVNGAVSHIRKMRIREVGEVIRRLGRPGSAPDPQVLAENSDIRDALAQLPPKRRAWAHIRAPCSGRGFSCLLGLGQGGLLIASGDPRITARSLSVSRRPGPCCRHAVTDSVTRVVRSFARWQPSAKRLWLKEGRTCDDRRLHGYRLRSRDSHQDHRVASRGPTCGAVTRRSLPPCPGMDSFPS
jgi:RNA polymerase sigma factor (sigma-70 family)